MLHTLGQAVIGIRGIGCFTGEQRPIAELPELAQNPKALRAFESRGFKHYTRSTLDVAQQAVHAARDALRAAALSPGDIGAVLVGTSEARSFTGLPERIAIDLLRGLGFGNVFVTGVNLGACANYASLLRMACALMAAEGHRHVLVVETNKCPEDGSDRLILPDMSVFSDGASACIVTREEPEFAICSLAQVTTPTPPALTVPAAAWLPHRMVSMRFVFDRALREAGATRADIKQLLLPNHGTNYLGAVAARLSIDPALVHCSNRAALAHAWSADNLINLHSYACCNGVEQGDLLVVMLWSEFSYAAMVLQAMERKAPRGPQATAASPTAAFGRDPR